MKRGSLITLAGCAAAALLLCGSAARAGGPIAVSKSGRPFTWNTAEPISYVVDPGPLGQIENARAAAWIEEAFRNWAGVEGVGLTATGSRYPRDITGENVLEFLDTLPSNQSFVIFDTDGSVFETLFGRGRSSMPGGIGGAWRMNPRTARIVQGFVIFSGLWSRISTADWHRVGLQHEVGHFLGLDHTQANAQVRFDGDATNEHLAPCMSYNQGPNMRPVLHAEDRAWIAALYRNGPSSTTGTIRGRVLFSDGQTGLQGIQVVARRDGDEEVTVVSGISGYRYRNPTWPDYGSRDVALQGLYELPGLPPGNYRLSIEPLSARTPVSPRMAFLPGGRQYWRDSGPLARAPEEATLVSVSAGGVVDGRDFVPEGPKSSPREVKAVTPAHLPELAQTLSLPAVVTGRVGPDDPKPWYLNLPNGSLDGIEAWHRLVIAEPTTLSATLEAGDPLADLNLYLVRDPSSTHLPDPEWYSADAGTPPETIQTRLLPGIYYLGVSFRDGSFGEATDYRLTVAHMPAPDLPAEPAPPRLTLAVVSHLTPSSMQVRWQMDRDGNAVVYVFVPRREFGSPALAREHVIAVTDLAPETRYDLGLHSRGVGNSEAPEIFGVTVDTPVLSFGGAPSLSGGLWSIEPQDEEGKEFLLVARVTNTGDGAALAARIEGLELPSGWRFVAPPSFPLDLGEIGAGSSAIVAVRVIRESGAAPPDLKLQGSYSTADRSIRAFGP